MITFGEIIQDYHFYIQEKGEPGLVTPLNCKVPTDILVSEHCRLKLNIAEILPDEKNEMWEFVTKTFPFYNQQQKINCCKVIQLIGYLL